MKNFLLSEEIFYVSEKNQFLAPGTYTPEKVNLDKAPQYSFGIRTPLDKPNTNPGIIYNHFIIFVIY